MVLARFPASVSTLTSVSRLLTIISNCVWCDLTPLTPPQWMEKLNAKESQPTDLSPPNQAHVLPPSTKNQGELSLTAQHLL